MRDCYNRVLFEGVAVQLRLDHSQLQPGSDQRVCGQPRLGDRHQRIRLQVTKYSFGDSSN
jgi:hypothetical protein